MDSVQLFKALGDSSRLSILLALKEGGPMYVELLTQRVNLSQSTVSFHLKKLLKCNLVVSKKEQYYTVFSLNDSLLNSSIVALLDYKEETLKEQQERGEKYKSQVLDKHIVDGKLMSLPIQKERRKIVLDYIIMKFSENRSYGTKEFIKILEEVTDEGQDLLNILKENEYIYIDSGVVWLNSYKEKEGIFKTPSIYKRFLYKDEEGVYLVKDNAFGKIIKLNKTSEEMKIELLFTTKGRILIAFKDSYDFIFTYHFLGEENKDVLNKEGTLFGISFLKEIYEKDTIKSKVVDENVICYGENFKLRGEGGLHGVPSVGSFRFTLKKEEFKVLQGKVFKDMFTLI